MQADNHERGVCRQYRNLKIVSLGNVRWFLLRLGQPLAFGRSLQRLSKDLTDLFFFEQTKRQDPWAGSPGHTCRD